MIYKFDNMESISDRGIINSIEEIKKRRILKIRKPNELVTLSKINNEETL